MRAGKQPLAKHLVAFRFWNGIQNEHENKCQQKISEKKEENMDKNDNGKRCQWQYALAPRSKCMWNNRNNNNTNSTHWWNVTVDLFTAILVCILLSMNAKHLEITTFCITKSNALSLFCDILAFLSWYPFFSGCSSFFSVLKVKIASYFPRNIHHPNHWGNFYVPFCS